MLDLENLLGGVQIAATICLQFGDTGKGKVSDLLASWADVNTRGTGADNAGHTIVLPDGSRVVYHLLPAGIAYDSLGKLTVLGNGMVINPKTLCNELESLVARGGSYNGLRIDENAGVIMPWHIRRDQGNKSQKNGGIGSTGRGVGPAYADKIARTGLTMRDILDRDTIVKKLEKIRQHYPEQRISDDETIEHLRPFAQLLRDYITDATQIVHDSIRAGKKVHIEGAQGTLLSINHGVYPYVTSSDCSIDGTASGIGISAGAVDLVLGLIKAPFMSRVGAGPFPTEFGGKRSEEYCAETNDGGNPTNSQLAELKRYGVPYKAIDDKKGEYNRSDPKIIEMMNSDDPFMQGIGIRLAADEYGSTTARPRRMGWTDAVAAKYAVKVNAPVKLVITKPDCMAGLKKFKVAYGYADLNGTSSKFPRTVRGQESVVPVYREYEGYGEIGEVRSRDKLPTSLREGLSELERFAGAPIVMVSNGPKKDQIMVA